MTWYVHVLPLKMNICVLVQGLYGQGKSGGKGFFALVRESQGKSGKVRESQGSLQWSGAK